MNAPIISSDSHVLEPGNLWLERLDKKYRDRAPRIFFDENSGRYKFGGEGLTPVIYSGLFAANKRGDKLAEQITKAASAAQAASEKDAPPGGWDPHQRLKDQDIDGVWAEVVYSSLAMAMFRVEDPAYQHALFRVYNNWLGEFCSVAPDRLIGMAQIPLVDVEEGVRELRRAHKLGLKGGMIFASPPADRPFTTRHYDPFWRTAEELSMPIGLHILTGHGAPSKRLLSDLTPVEFLTGLMSLSDEVVYSFTDIVFSGVLERFPKLKLVSAENEVGWIPFWLHMADQWWNRYKKSHPNELTMQPSDYFKRQMYATFLEDPIGVHCAQLPLVGYDNLMWGSDYPHGSSTWPNSLKVIDRIMPGVNQANRRKMLTDNCAKLYGLRVAEAVA
ncbi:MAG: amidohydrolase [Betaproteobacteria bacterium]|nr:amidohydrolase [Betaproteobacteria bacterium]